MAIGRSRASADPSVRLRSIVDTATTDAGKACGEARAAVRDHPDVPLAYRVLALTLRRLGNITEAERAELKAIEIGLRQPAVVAAEQALADDKLEDAERSIKFHLRENPEDAGAALILGTIAERCGAIKEAENLFRRATLLAPAYMEAHIALAKLLKGVGRIDETFLVLDAILARDEKHLVALSLKAGLFVQLRQLDEAQVVFERLLRAHPGDGRGWMNHAYLLKTAGRFDEAIVAYRKAVDLEPGRGSAWWGMANLKTFAFQADDIARMKRALDREGIDDNDRIHLHFALGKAMGDHGDYAGAFEHYETGNRLRLAQAPHDPDRVAENVRQVERVFTPALLKHHLGRGCPADDPIFIVSLPRSGSTLVEQILASHPLIEGTEELYDIERIALELAPDQPAGSYLDRLNELSPSKRRELGEHYIAATRRHRKTDRPFFTDKMPGNWIYIALIQAILPNAKIIDVRRHPLGCGVANFVQHFNWGINFAYDLKNIGQYYSEYVRLMQHFDTVMPGRIHRIFYENLVADTETEIRRLLTHLGLPFDPACLRFHENKRAVHTPSSEQVRRPINRDGMNTWRSYEPWLNPLKDALGPVLEAYPDVPKEWRA